VSQTSSRHLAAPAPDHRTAAWLLLAVAALVLAAGLGLGAPSSADARPRLVQCTNNIDDDGDGTIDFRDKGCLNGRDNDETDPAIPSVCADTVDNDGDGRTDFPNDPGCATAGNNSEVDPASPPLCANTFDDDLDGLIDYGIGAAFDPDCWWAGDNVEASRACSDGVDNDGDGKIDFPADIGCEGPNNQNETDLPQCDDGRDNDGDGTLDFDTTIAGQTRDPDCSSAADPTEGPDPTPSPAPARCADGIDNDGDGKIDYPADSGCSSPGDNDETNPPPVVVILAPSCADGVDNDRDGKTDFPADGGCSSATDDDETGFGGSGGTSGGARLLSPFPIVRLRGRVQPSSVRITLFTVRAPAASKVSIYCTGRSCPYRRLVIGAGRRTVRVRKFERRLRGRAVLRIYVTKPGFVGKYTRFRFRSGRAPLRDDRCARTAGSAPRNCPGS
jgi:hypothetical protein